MAARNISPPDLQRLGRVLEQRPVAIGNLNMPQVRRISRSEFDALTRAGNGEDFWAEFYKRHPGSAGWVVLSAPAIEGSGGTAWLLMDHLYGSLGAERWLLSLTRGRDGWVVARKWLLWQFLSSLQPPLGRLAAGCRWTSLCYGRRDAAGHLWGDRPPRETLMRVSGSR